MIRRPTTRRTGTSLLEVLVGLGILAIGAISAFVLFPFSAINVSRALVDDRTTTCAVTADGELRAIHRQWVVEPESPPISGTSGEPYHRAMDWPGNVTLAPPNLPPAVPKNSPQASYAVFVDPMGFALTQGGFVGNGGTAVPPPNCPPTLIPRLSLAAITSRPAIEQNSLALRYCSQLDGLLFDDGGAVSTQNSNEMRELRYNWLWVLQRPVNRDRHTVRMQIVVFNRRAHLYAPPGSEAVHDGTPASNFGGPLVTFVPGENTILNVPQTAEITKGTWVMDGTVGTDKSGLPIRHAEWYRVTNVTEVTATSGVTTLVLETHKPISRVDGLISRGVSGAANPFAYTGTLVVFPGVVEVFERPVLTGLGGP